MKGDELLSLCRAALARAGQGDAELYARSRDRGFARFAVGELGQHMDVREPEVLARVALGKRVAEAATSVLEEDALVEAIRRAAAAAAFVPERDDFTGFAGADEPDGPRPPRYAARTAAATAEERVALLAPVLERVRGAGFVSAGALETQTTAECIATTGGLGRAHDSTVAQIKVWALATPGAGGAAGYGGQMHRDLAALDLARETERAVERCAMGKDPIALDAGSYDVVLEPEAVSELLEWLATITFDAREVEQGTSAFAGRIGETLTGAGVTLVEDPLDASATGFGTPFDREGTWRRRVLLVERGVARGVLHDRATARRMGAASTGSALLGGFGGSSGGVGPTALTMDGGAAESVAELVAGMERGLYVCRLHYVNGYLEPRRAVLTGLTRDGLFLVERGKITRAVGNMRFTDSLLEALGRSDGMTRARTAVPTWWSESGACVTPAVRVRGLRFSAGTAIQA